MKIVVFDVDETLGHFAKLGIFWDCLKKYLTKRILNKTDFVALLDIFPEFIRPNILSILKYVKEQKINNKCNRVMIYTNNQGEKEWMNNIKYYFQEKLQYDLFDNIISAFKTNGVRIEWCRTTHSKCMNDLLKCAKISPATEVCFIDDVYYPNMLTNNVYYIHLKPYKHDVSFGEMLNRVIATPYFNKYIDNKDKCRITMTDCFIGFNYIEIEKSIKEYEIDKLVGKKILEHLIFFFKDNSTKTRKKRVIKINKSKTLKIRP